MLRPEIAEPSPTTQSNRSYNPSVGIARLIAGEKPEKVFGGELPILHSGDIRAVRGTPGLIKPFVITLETAFSLDAVDHIRQIAATGEDRLPRSAVFDSEALRRLGYACFSVCSSARQAIEIVSDPINVPDSGWFPQVTAKLEDYIDIPTDQLQQQISQRLYETADSADDVLPAYYQMLFRWMRSRGLSLSVEEFSLLAQNSSSNYSDPASFLDDYIHIVKERGCPAGFNENDYASRTDKHLQAGLRPEIKTYILKEYLKRKQRLDSGIIRVGCPANEEGIIFDSADNMIVISESLLGTMNRLTLDSIMEQEASETHEQVDSNTQW